MDTIAETPVHVLARKVWGAFAFTFVISRILVFLSMSGRMPDIHPQLGGTRLHHLNYGIFLLAGVGAALLFSRPTGRWLSATSPALRQFRPRHWATAIALVATLALFGIVLLDSYRYAGRKLGPYLEQVRPPRQP